MTRRTAWAAPAVFGTADGLTTLVGVLLSFSLTQPSPQVLHTAFGVAVAGGLSMGVGQYLSNSATGVIAGLVIGIATAVGTLLPALPYAALHGWAARTAAGLILLAMSAGIAAVRARQPASDAADAAPLGPRRATVQTIGLLLAVAAATWAISLVTPGGVAN